jgi:signal transduction histidine kinase/CheY-like chemotaxis protein
MRIQDIKFVEKYKQLRMLVCGSRKILNEFFNRSFGPSRSSRWYKRIVIFVAFTVGSSFTFLLSRNIETRRQDLMRSSFKDRASALMTNFDLAIANNSIRLNSFESSLWKSRFGHRMNSSYVQQILHNSSFSDFTLVRMRGFDHEGLPILQKYSHVVADKESSLPNQQGGRTTAFEVRRAAQFLNSTHGFQLPFLTEVGGVTLLDICMRSVEHPNYFFIFTGRADQSIPNLDLLSSGDFLFVRQTLDGSSWSFSVNTKGQPIVKRATNAILAGPFDYSYQEDTEEENTVEGIVPFQRSVKRKSHDADGNIIPQAIMLIGFGMTVLASAFLSSVLNRKEEVEDLVIEKTKALSIETEKANASVRAKSQFLANVSHEIRTPLNMILGMADVASELSSSDQQKDYLYNLKNAGKHLLVLIDDILEMARIEAHDIHFERTEVDLVPLLENVIELTWPNISKKNLHFIIDIDLSLPTLIQTDPSRIKQIILNLLNNALKYTKEGFVSISVKKSDAKEQEKKENVDWIEFRVRDSGIGIPQDKQKEIFLPFYQVGKSQFRDSGVGLGLAIINGLVSKFNGVILLNSESGKGADFKVLLPVEKRDATPWSTRLVNMDKKSQIFLGVENVEVRRQVHDYFSQIGVEVSDFVAMGGLASVPTSSDRHSSILIIDQASRPKDFRQLLSSFERIIVLNDRPMNNPSEYTNVKYLNEPIVPSKLFNALGWMASGKKRMENSIELDRTKVNAADKIQANSNLSLIIADDDPSNQTLMSAYLRNTPWKIRFADDGQQAYDACMQSVPDIIVADLQMPNVDGFMLLKKIRESEGLLKGKMPKFIILTADAISEVEEEAKKLKVSMFLTKPIDKARFFHAISQVMSEENPPSTGGHVASI